MKPILRFMTALLAGLLLTQLAAWAQGTLRGKVTDADGAPLAGVTVLVKGTSNGTMTGVDGTYTLKASAGDVIEFSCLGLSTEERTFDGKTPISVSLREGCSCRTGRECHCRW